MIKTLSHLQIPIYTIIFIFLLSSNIILFSQSSQPVIIYVWDFSTRDHQKNDFTWNLTEEFEEMIIEKGCFTVLERRNYAQLISHIDNEKAILEIENISNITKDSLNSYEAKTVVFGEVYYDTYIGEIKVTISFQNFNGTKKKWSTRLKMEDQYNRKKRTEAVEILVRDIVKKCCPSRSKNDIEPLGVKLNSVLPIIGSLSFGAAALIYKDKANEEYENIPPIVSEEKIKAWRSYKKFQIRSNFYPATALNLAISSLPFLSDWTNKGPRIDRWTLACLFFTSSATFTTFGIISSNKANNVSKKLNIDYSEISEDHVILWGEYEEYKEMATILYTNAAINFLTAIQILLFYYREDENGGDALFYNDSQKSFSISFNFNDKFSYNPSIIFCLQKRF